MRRSEDSNKGFNKQKKEIAIRVSKLFSYFSQYILMKTPTNIKIIIIIFFFKIKMVYWFNDINKVCFNSMILLE